MTNPPRSRDAITAARAAVDQELAELIDVLSGVVAKARGMLETHDVTDTYAHLAVTAREFDAVAYRDQGTTKLLAAALVLLAQMGGPLNPE